VKVLVTDHVFRDLEAEREALAAIGCELEQAPDTDPETLAAAAAGAAGIMVCFAQVDERVIEATKDCKIVARYGIGVDNVDVEAATRRGIQVTNVPDYCLDEVADHAMALLLAAARGVVGAALGVREGDWTVPQENIHRIAGRRLALIGGGRIGRRVADRARAFGYEVVVYDPYAGDSVASVEEAVADADAVSVHAPLTDETRDIIGEATLAAMKRRPILVNTSRGGLVDEPALAEALAAGAIRAAALDVFSDEPAIPRVLRSRPDVTLTPHIGGLSERSIADMTERATSSVLEVLDGRPDPATVANPAVLR
jgi:D-3-phosphoglycerate dehydrogenase